MISFLCSHCGAQLRVKPELAGTTGKCPRCGKAVEAPSGANPAIEVIPIERPPSGAGSRDTSRPLFETASSQGRDDELAILSPAREPDELGRMGNYRILKVLGQGGMGIVFLAEDIALKRQVALKVMKKAQAKVPDNRQRFVLEARAAAAIEHDHIVTIYQVGEENGVPFIAMKLLQGESLEERLNRMGRLPVEEVVRVGQEIADGLAAAHERGLIHRDIKPANVWLEEGRDRVKIVDFGLARAANEDVRLTQENYMVGTPMYMSPEQAESDMEVDHRCDLFSLGGVLYRMSTGELPFKGKTTMQVLNALATKEARPPDEVNPSVPRRLSALIMNLLQKDRNNRPRTARAVVASLEELRAAPQAAEPVEVIEEIEEIEEIEVVEGPEEEEEVVELDPVPEKRKPRPKRRPARKQEVAEEGDDSGAARKAILFAIFAGVFVVLLFAALVVKNMFFTKKDPPSGGASEQPKQSSRVKGLASRVG